MDEGTRTARRRMLDAGAEIWAEPTTEVFGGLSVTGVARAAGVTRSTFYAHWPTPELYLRDLVRHLADPMWGPVQRDHTAVRATFRTGGIQLLDRLLSSCNGYVESVLDDPAFPLRMGLTSRIHDPELADVLREAMATADADLGQMLQRLDVTWGREARPPFEWHHLPAIFTTLADGLAIRHQLEPERFPLTLYGPSVLALLLLITRHPDDPRDLPRVLAMVNDWPTSGWTAATRASSLENERPTDIEVRSLVHEARRLISAEGWLEVSLSRLAALTSTPEPQVVRTFGSKSGLALALFLLEVSERYDHLETTDDALADLRRMIDIRVEELQRTVAITSAMLSILSGNATYSRPHTFSFDPHRRFVAAVKRAQDEGHLDLAHDAEELAGVLEYTILFSNLGLTPRLAPTTDAIELVLRGAGAPPKSP